MKRGRRLARPLRHHGRALRIALDHPRRYRLVLLALIISPEDFLEQFQRDGFR
jgi:hypothetical protein